MLVEKAVCQSRGWEMATNLMTSGDCGTGAAAGELEHPIVFFDGVCGLCNRSLDFLLLIDRRHVLRFAPLQGETARQVLRIDPQDELRTIVVCDRAGQARQSAAIVKILGHLGGFWKFVSWLLWLIPRPLRDIGYNLIARNRYRMFGKTEACRMPKPGERELFLP
jgi:predicted DCC family thiol-disulfide oxidoreductase YuxK